jgi:hypothetical protein
LRKGLAAGAGTVAFGLLANKAEASGGLTIGDAAILQFLAVLETLETDFWQQYNELGGIQDSEVPGGSGSTAYTAALQVLDSDMPQYIRLLNGQFPAIPRSDDDTKGSNIVFKPDGSVDFDKSVITHHLQAIANTAGFHFAMIEQGGSSLYPSLAQRVTHREVLRILLSIGPTETMHFQTWQDKAGNAPPLSDPTNGLVFPDLNSPPFGGEDFQTNLIMPEPCPFLSRKFPVCSIIRPTETTDAAMGAVKFLTDTGLFRGQSPEFFALLKQLAQAADAARHGGEGTS